MDKAMPLLRGEEGEVVGGQPGKKSSEKRTGKKSSERSIGKKSSKRRAGKKNRKEPWNGQQGRIREARGCGGNDVRDVVFFCSLREDEHF